MTDEQVPPKGDVGHQSVNETRLCLLIEVKHDITAEHHIERADTREWLNQIHLTELYQAFNFRLDCVHYTLWTALCCEEALLPLRGQIRALSLRVAPRLCLREDALGKVRRKDLRCRKTTRN